MKIIKYLLIGLLLTSVSTINAQTDILEIKKTEEIKDYTPGIIQSALVGVKYRVKAGACMGGTMPIPLPEEIRSIEGFRPKLNLSLEGEIVKAFNDRWAFMFGLRLENKGMETKAKVKGYNITMYSDDGKLSGLFTGNVKTTVNNSYLTLPVLGRWKPAERFGIKLGAYCSYLIQGEFSGAAYDGYLREGGPTGDYIEISQATYQFSDDLRHWNFGLQLGAEWRAFSHLFVSLDGMFGLNSIFQKDFDVITFEMYPMFAALNFGYQF